MSKVVGAVGLCSSRALMVPELFARFTLLDEHDRLIGHIGANPEIVEHKAWPEVPRDLVQPRKFNSPHDLAADARGNLFVVEWLVGGRITKLERERIT